MRRNYSRRSGSPLFYFLLGPLLLFLLFSFGSYLLEPPPLPITPTPVPTAQSFGESLLGAGQVNAAGSITDPVSEIVPAADPDLIALLDQVSIQNLQAYVITLERFGTRNTFSATDRDDFGIGAARRWIFSEFERVGNGRLQVAFQDYNFNYLGIETQQSNVVATLPGTGDNPGVLIMVANYDTAREDVLDGESPNPGADDNGSGVAALLEVARLMSARTWNQTVIFLASTAEEQGTFGSGHFVQRALIDGLQINAVLNNDMIGGRAGIPQSARLFAMGPDTSVHQQLARYLDYIGGLYLPTFPVTLENALDRDGRWGDQRPFVQAGFPAVRLIESEEDLDIQSSTRDVWSLVDFTYLQRMTQLNLATLASMAGGPPRPTLPLIRGTNEPGSYQLNWEMVPGAAAYVISFRSLGSVRYEPFRFVSADQAGDVILTGFTAPQGYAVSMAAVDGRGRVGAFTPEVIVAP